MDLINHFRKPVGFLDNSKSNNIIFTILDIYLSKVEYISVSVNHALYKMLFILKSIPWSFLRYCGNLPLLFQDDKRGRAALRAGPQNLPCSHFEVSHMGTCFTDVTHQRSAVHCLSTAIHGNPSLKTYNTTLGLNVSNAPAHTWGWRCHKQNFSPKTQKIAKYKQK